MGLAYGDRIMSAAMAWTWFGVAWLFIVAVLLSRWFARERADQKATEAELKRCKADTTGEHIWDAG